ncbi:MAG: toll/interleukin-1 receptor domain-containing protein [Rhodospirillaceae bacterium]|nr:toll/interleukin-1 receptor domain-containing protein [Rhodospirillaceae bacterium]
MSTDENVARVRYKAFISYSHRDSAVARWLHRALETYRVPPHLIGRTTAAGTVERRLGALFRDRDELPVAADLTGQINEALKATQFLIVLCSTASARSKWVNQEVVNFKRLKGAGSIIAVIVDGEPYASNMPGREAEECFVPALRFQVAADGSLTDTPAEPIAADLRPGKDGKRLVKLKVLAGLLGVGLDELVQRETQRRQRFMAAVTFASLAGVATMGALTFNAIEARNEAETKREQAEGLVEYMLSDLGERLQAVGRLDVLDSLSSRTLEYYARQKPEDLDSDALGRRARALILLGKIEDKRGDPDAAFAAFTDAHETTGERLARDPRNPNLIFDHAQSIYWIGYVHSQQRQFSKAASFFEQYSELAKSLVAARPENRAWQNEVGYAETNLGVMLYRSGRFHEAEAAFKKANLAHREVSLSDPNNTVWQTDLGRTLAWLADTHRALGDLSMARQERLAEIAIYDELVRREPRNVQFLQPLLVSQRMLGAVLLESGEPENAISALRNAERLADRLVSIEPSNTAWAELQGRTKLDLAESLLYAGEPLKSRAVLTEAETITARLVALRPGFTRWQVSLRARAEILRCEPALRDHPPASALRSIGTLIDDLEKFRREDNQNMDLIMALAQANLARGDLSHELLNAAERDVSWKTAVTLLESNQTTDNMRALYLAKAYWRLGRTAEHIAMVETLTRQGLKHPATAEFLKDSSVARSGS